MKKITNPKVIDYEFLKGMYNDGYFPNHLVDKIKAILIEMCLQIEDQNPTTEEDLLSITHKATEQINDLEKEFEENDSELETEAREVMGENFHYLVKAYGRSGPHSSTTAKLL